MVPGAHISNAVVDKHKCQTAAVLLRKTVIYPIFNRNTDIPTSDHILLYFTSTFDVSCFSVKIADSALLRCRLHVYILVFSLPAVHSSDRTNWSSLWKNLGLTPNLIATATATRKEVDELAAKLCVSVLKYCHWLKLWTLRQDFVKNTELRSKFINLLVSRHSCGNEVLIWTTAQSPDLRGATHSLLRGHSTIWLSCLAVWLCVANWALMSTKFYNVLFSFAVTNWARIQCDMGGGRSNSCMKKARPVSLSKCKTYWLTVMLASCSVPMCDCHFLF